MNGHCSLIKPNVEKGGSPVRSVKLKGGFVILYTYQTTWLLSYVSQNLKNVASGITLIDS